MADAMTLISTVTVGSGGAASIDFNSIAGTYTDLLLVVSARINNGATTAAMNMTFNNNTSSYSMIRLFGNGSSANSSSNVSGTSSIFLGGQVGSAATANTFGNGTVYIPNYAGSTNKSVSYDGVAETNGTATEETIIAGLWANTAAITSIKLVDYHSTTFLQYSTASLYGILKGSGGATVS